MPQIAFFEGFPAFRSFQSAMPQIAFFEGFSAFRSFQSAMPQIAFFEGFSLLRSSLRLGGRSAHPTKPSRSPSPTSGRVLLSAFYVALNLNIQVFDAAGVFFDEFSSGFYLVAHKSSEGYVNLG